MHDVVDCKEDDVNAGVGLGVEVGFSEHHHWSVKSSLWFLCQDKCLIIVSDGCEMCRVNFLLALLCFG